MGRVFSRIACAIIIFASAYTYGVASRNIEEANTQLSVSESMKWPTQREAVAAVAELSSHRNESITTSAMTAEELEAVLLRWQIIRVCAAIVGAFGFACLYWLLTLRGRPTGATHQENT